MMVRSASTGNARALDLFLRPGPETAAHFRLVPAEGHRPADHHACGIDRMHQAHDADAQVPGRFQYDLERQRVARLGLLSTNSSGVSSSPASIRAVSDASPAGVERFLGPLDDGRGAGIGLEVARLAAGAQPGVLADSR